MTGLLLSNLDASTSPYHTGPQNGMPWFAILNKEHSPRPAWRAFKSWREDQVAKRSRPAPSDQQAPPPASGQAAPPAPALDPTVPLSQTDGGEPASVLAPQPALAQEGSGQAAAVEPSTPTPTLTPAPAPPVSPATGPARPRVGKTDGTGANLRERPSGHARPIAILMDGTTVEVIGEDVQAEGMTWRNVRTTASTTDGVTGWVAAQYLVP
jgi:hypothetical protein